MTLSWTKAFRPAITETTPTRVDTPMMMPSRVRKLRRRWARIAWSASRNSSPVTIATARCGRRVLPGLFELHGIPGLDLAQGTEGAVDHGLAALEAIHHLQVQLTQEPGLDRLEAGFVALHQEDALLVARLTGLRLL